MVTDGRMTEDLDLAEHWDEAYAQGDATRSWFQDAPRMSLRMLDAAGVTAAGSLIDVGGGASPLAAALLARGFRDVTVLDISAVGMRYARERLGRRAVQVHWLTADVRTWRPPRCFAVWHDRAVFHFLTADPALHLGRSAQEPLTGSRCAGAADHPGAARLGRHPRRGPAPLTHRHHTRTAARSRPAAVVRASFGSCIRGLDGCCPGAGAVTAEGGL